MNFILLFKALRLNEKNNAETNKSLRRSPRKSRDQRTSDSRSPQKKAQSNIIISKRVASNSEDEIDQSTILDNTTTVNESINVSTHKLKELRIQLSKLNNNTISKYLK